MLNMELKFRMLLEIHRKGGKGMGSYPELRHLYLCSMGRGVILM